MVMIMVPVMVMMIMVVVVVGDDQAAGQQENGQKQGGNQDAFHEDALSSQIVVRIGGDVGGNVAPAARFSVRAACALISKQ